MNFCLLPLCRTPACEFDELVIMTSSDSDALVDSLLQREERFQTRYAPQLHCKDCHDPCCLYTTSECSLLSHIQSQLSIWSVRKHATQPQQLSLKQLVHQCHITQMLRYACKYNKPNIIYVCQMHSCHAEIGEKGFR